MIYNGSPVWLSEILDSRDHRDGSMEPTKRPALLSTLNSSLFGLQEKKKQAGTQLNSQKTPTTLNIKAQLVVNGLPWLGTEL